MSPRAGGEADKFGNRYEGAWTVAHILHVLAGTADSVTVEPIGEIGNGVEFVVRTANEVQVHQVKRQIATRNSWSIAALKGNDVLSAARNHVAAGRRFHFVSVVPARLLDELADRARRSDDLTSFIRNLADETEQLRDAFDELASPSIFDSTQVAWETLRGTWIRWPDERFLRNANEVMASLFLEGASPLSASVVLGDLVVNNLGIRLDSAKIESLLTEYGLSRARLIGSPSHAQLVRTAVESWKSSVERELLQPAILRPEAVALMDQLAQDERIVLAVGAAGAGKSAVLHQALALAEQKDWAVLGLRLDRIEPFSSTVQLGRHLGFGISPAAALAAISAERPSLLVVDQLDAISLASGRMPAMFDTIIDLFAETSAFNGMRVLVACRKFDVENDHRIRRFASNENVGTFQIEELDEQRVDEALRHMGVSSDNLNRKQKDLLRSPFSLVLLNALRGQTEQFTFGSTRDLLDAYWERKRQDCNLRRPSTRFGKVIDVLATEMSQKQRLVAPVAVLDEDDLAADAGVLASEHILVRHGRTIGFFHESFFDYAFARRWTRRGESLVDFLISGEQELFRRSQVRQILDHLHDEDLSRFIVETEAVLTHPGIRYHVKDVVLGVIRSLEAPTRAEWDMVARILATEPRFSERLWLSIRTLPWFDLLDNEGIIAGWLEVDEALQARALEVMLAGAKERSDRLAELLSPHADREPQFASWLRWTTRYADLHLSRQLLDLVLHAVRRGDYNSGSQDLWLAAHQLGKKEPAWAAELVVAYLADRPDAFARNSAGQIPDLDSAEYGLTELIADTADGAPQAFCDLLLPYMLRVMSETEYGGAELPLRDWHFTGRHLDMGVHQVDQALVRGARIALSKFVAESPEMAQAALEILASDPHESAQWLLYETLRTQPERYAGWAVELLLEGRHRLLAGYGSNSVWATRLLVEAILPHVTADDLSRLEQPILDLRFSWEGRQSGWYSFNLLSVIPESRMSDRARRRLGELRRLFGVEQPPAPTDPVGGSIVSPVPAAATPHMTDSQWLRAIKRYQEDAADYATLRGGVHELGQLLQSEVAKAPERFAQLAQRFTRATHPAYVDAVLQGLANAEEPASLDLVCQTLRHIDSLGNPANDRWFCWPLRRYLQEDVPDDVINLVLKRALSSSDPAEDVWSRRSPGGASYFNGDIHTNGINTARGQASEMLGDLLVYDSTGHRTALVSPFLAELSADQSVAVRACVGHVVAASYRHAREAANAAFAGLINIDDRLLVTPHIETLVVRVAHESYSLAEPVIRRMLKSNFDDVRKAGGRLAAYVGLELEASGLLDSIRNGSDSVARAGAALVCSHRLPHTSNVQLAMECIEHFVSDDVEEVRTAAGSVAAVLRSAPLTPFKKVLESLIDSPSFMEALGQLLITLAHAPDRIDGLVLKTVGKFVEAYRAEMGNISTRAAGEAREVGELVLRAYAQATDREGRRRCLDLLDELLLFGAYGVVDLVDNAER